MAFLSAGTNSHRDQDVRRALAPLKQVAEELDAAVLVIRHLNKNSAGGPALYRGGGSTGIIGAARSGLLLARSPSHEKELVLASQKSNLGPCPPALRLQVVPSGRSCRIEWLGETELTANDLVTPRQESGDQTSAVDDAAHFLSSLLAEGPLSYQEVVTEAKVAGVMRGP